MIKRLSLLVGAASLLASAAFGAMADKPVEIGLQLYSLRGQFLTQVPETIQLVAKSGVKEVELAGTYGIAPATFKKMLTDAGLHPVSGHFPFEKFDKALPEVVAEVKALGLAYAGTAWIPHEGGFDEADARRAIEVFNRAGKELAKHGVQFFYHCHGYEFQRYGDATLMDLIIRETDEDAVAFEMDTLWVYLPGEDPAAWLRKYPSRWQLLHLKDIRKGVARAFDGAGRDKENNVVLGTGQMDFKALLEAAREVGVRHYFIEDESSAAPAQIPQSVTFLKQATAPGGVR